ncbi:MAG: FkbM family methyltransferase [Nitrosopumilaceae archaeon]
MDCLRNYEFWKNFQEKGWEEQTFKIFNKFLDKNHSYIDIGAWIGSTVLYGCQLAKHSYAIEPDPIAFKELRKNIRLNNNLNSKITLSNLCISDSIGSTKLFTPAKTLSGGGRSGSTILEKGYENFWMVETVTLSKFIKSLSIIDCNFIKMDIEGAEFTVLPEMFEYIQNQKPTMLIEFHPMFVEHFSEKLKQISPIFNFYKHIYDINLKEINIKNILNVDPSKTFHLVLSNNTV